MSKRLIAIGDVHGCVIALKALLAEIQPVASDVVVPLGDLVDRGPDSKSVVELMMQLSQRCELRLILGNHEEMMLDVVLNREPPQEWLRHGGVATLDSYGFVGDLAIIPPEHVEFLAAAQPVFETEQHFFTHGNYDPNLPLDQQPSELLRWTSLIQSTPGPHTSGKKAILGHTPDQSGEIFDIGHLQCIDTYCYGGQWLTAIDVLSGKVWQANEQGESR